MSEPHGAADPSAGATSAEPAWLHGHPHEPNAVTPAGDGSFLLVDGAQERRITPASLAGFPQTQIDDCFIASTGHGTSGPYSFGGVRLGDFLARTAPGRDFAYVDVVGADEFGARLTRAEIESAMPRSPLLALSLDGQPLTRAAGLVRLIVPGEIDDALKQVKWVARVVIGE